MTAFNDHGLDAPIGATTASSRTTPSSARLRANGGYTGALRSTTRRLLVASGCVCAGEEALKIEHTRITVVKTMAERREESAITPIAGEPHLESTACLTRAEEHHGNVTPRQGIVFRLAGTGALLGTFEDYRYRVIEQDIG